MTVATREEQIAALRQLFAGGLGPLTAEFTPGQGEAAAPSIGWQTPNTLAPLMQQARTVLGQNWNDQTLQWMSRLQGSDIATVNGAPLQLVNDDVNGTRYVGIGSQGEFLPFDPAAAAAAYKSPTSFVLPSMADPNDPNRRGRYYASVNPDGSIGDVNWQDTTNDDDWSFMDKLLMGGALAGIGYAAAPVMFGGAGAAGAEGIAAAGAAPISASSPTWLAGYGSTLGLTPAQIASVEASLAAGGAGAGASGISMGAGAPISASPISSLGPSATWGDKLTALAQGNLGAVVNAGRGAMDWGSLLTSPNAWLTGAQLLGGLWGDNMLANAGEAQARAAAQASASNAAIANRSLDMQQEQWDFGKSLIEKYQPLYERLINANVGMAEDARERSNAQWADYDQIFRPIEKKFASDAMNYDSPEEIARRTGLASATVQNQIDAQREQRARTLAATGVDPASGRNTIDDANAMAMAKAGAVNKERNDTVLQGISMRQAAANFGRNMPNTSIAQNAAALQGNASASNTAGAATAQPGVALQPALAFGNQAITANNSAGGLSQAGANFDLTRSLNRTSSAGNVLGLGLGYLSDERAKEGISAVDDEESLEDVRMTPVSEWDYKPGMGDGGHHVGAMAQDLQASMGSEVAPGGKMVDPISYMGKMHSAIRALDKKVSKLMGGESADFSTMGLKPLRI